MKIYLAGASSERDMIRGYRDRLIAAGHRIALDWIAVMDEKAAAGIADRDLSANEAESIAFADASAAMQCDVFWLLTPVNPKASVGCWFEFGAAYAECVTAYVSGDPKASIFCRLANKNYATHEEAFAEIVKLGKEVA